MSVFDLTNFQSLRAPFPGSALGVIQGYPGNIFSGGEDNHKIYSRAAIGFTELTPEERAAFRPVRQRLVRTHPVTGRKSLFLASHAGAIEGWTVPEAQMFLRDLIEHATQPQFVYAHKWRVGDLVIWDNRQTMHRARRFDRNEIRDVRRTTLAGDVPTIEQVA